MTYAILMNQQQTTSLATAIVIVTGVLWGLYWLPIRSLRDAGLDGAWGTLAITSAAVLLLCPAAVLRRRHLLASNRIGLLSIALGGAAFALYSIGFVYGHVAIIILLYFLTPVWSSLFARYVMGWHTPLLRVVAIFLGLAGLYVMLSSDGGLPVPQGTGEWMALLAGGLWSIATTGMRVKSRVEPVAAAFVFALGATVTALVVAPWLGAWPAGPDVGGFLEPAALALATGGLWWVLSTAALMWATVRLEPARVGILLMTEVIVGAASAAVLAGEHLAPRELVGGALVLCAGVLEVWPAKRSCNEMGHPRS
ncbi:EamA-like transporter family protein [Roseivivax jejudonensis]|uniref:EamA-like transporter family protein n=1 Tax=Roseivivax jejudonensis TaxID=1529041 RepID=A0A1X6Y7A4_9RHOB|nr:DMT family transporter [Roseivivax jejudonensis]SLN11091.1 EamA-like transporter family protein [Roseivivax jejudonensis]